MAFDCISWKNTAWLTLLHFPVPPNTKPLDWLLHPSSSLFSVFPLKTSICLVNIESFSSPIIRFFRVSYSHPLLMSATYASDYTSSFKKGVTTMKEDRGMKRKKEYGSRAWIKHSIWQSMWHLLYLKEWNLNKTLGAHLYLFILLFLCHIILSSGL